MVVCRISLVCVLVDLSKYVPGFTMVGAPCWLGCPTWSEIMIKHTVHKLQDEAREVAILGVPITYECYVGSRCFVTKHFDV